jgi:poly(A) polymerase
MDRVAITTDEVVSPLREAATVADGHALDQLTEVLVREDPTEGLWHLIESGFMDRYVPEISALAMEQDPVHRHKDVLSHTVIVTANTSPRLVVRLAALFHDVGKPKTRRFVGRKVTFHHHEVVGARQTKDRLTQLGFEPQLVDDVARLVELSGRFHGYQHGWEDSAVRRYARDAGPLLGDLNELVRCDCTTRYPEKLRGLQQRMDHLEQRIRDLAYQDEQAKIRPDLNGEAVMEILGIGPGPHVGAALKMLLDIKRNGTDLSPDEARRTVEQWWADQAGPTGSAN